jgi:hypothetical protein
MRKKKSRVSTSETRLSLSSVAAPFTGLNGSRLSDLSTEAHGRERERSAIAVQRSRRSWRGRSRSGFGRNWSSVSAAAAITTTAAAVAAAAAAVATTSSVATAMASTAVAVATTTAAAIAATTAAITTVAAMATMATVAGNSRLLTTQQGDADDRDKNRDAHNQSAVHPRILQKTKNRYLGVTKQLPSDTSHPRLGRLPSEGTNFLVSYADRVCRPNPRCLPCKL